MAGIAGRGAELLLSDGAAAPGYNRVANVTNIGGIDDGNTWTFGAIHQEIELAGSSTSWLIVSERPGGLAVGAPGYELS